MTTKLILYERNVTNFLEAGGALYLRSDWRKDQVS